MIDIEKYARIGYKKYLECSGGGPMWSELPLEEQDAWLFAIIEAIAAASIDKELCSFIEEYKKYVGEMK